MPEAIQTRLLHLTSKNEIGWQSVASPSEGYSDVCVSSWASRRLTISTRRSVPRMSGAGGPTQRHGPPPDG